MAFAELVRTDAERVLVRQLRSALQVPSYTHNPGQIFDNLQRDGEIPDIRGSGPRGSRRALLTHLSSESGDSSAVSRDDYRNYCHKHNREGSEATQAKSKVLGHVHELQALAKWLRDENSGEALEDTVARLRRLCEIANPRLRFERQREELSDRPLGRYSHWSFYDQQSPARPFARLGTSKEDVVVRLGLGHWDEPGHELVRWCQRPGEEKPLCRPTAWDADGSESSVYWRPGGRTCPLRTGHGPGVPEVVHKPCEGEELETPMTPLED